MEPMEPLPAGGHLLIASEVELAEQAPEAGVKEEDGAATPGPAKVAKPDGASTPGAAKQVLVHETAAVSGQSGPGECHLTSSCLGCQVRWGWPA